MSDFIFCFDGVISIDKTILFSLNEYNHAINFTVTPLAATHVSCNLDLVKYTCAFSRSNFVELRVDLYNGILFCQQCGPR